MGLLALIATVAKSGLLGRNANDDVGGDASRILLLLIEEDRLAEVRLLPVLDCLLVLRIATVVVAAVVLLVLLLLLEALEALQNFGFEGGLDA